MLQIFKHLQFQNNILRRGERDISYDAAYAQYYYQPYPIQYNLSNYQGKLKFDC